MVGNEHHLLLVCPSYQRERKALLDIACKKFNISSADLDNSIYMMLIICLPVLWKVMIVRLLIKLPTI